MVGGVAIGFEGDEVVELGDFEFHVAADVVLPSDDGGGNGYAEAQDVGLVWGFLVGGSEAVAVVFEGNAGFLGGGAELGQAFGGAPTAVENAFFEEFVGVLAINIEALGLEVRAVLAALAGAFVGGDAEGFEAIVDLVDGAFDEAGTVGVFDAEYENAAGVASPEPVE